jgi:hypothetical protein
VQGLDLEYDLQQKRRTLIFEIRTRPAAVFRISENVVQTLAKQPGVQQVKWM